MSTCTSWPPSGVAQLPASSALSWLVRWEATAIPVYAITETRLLSAKTQRFIEFLQECLKRP